MAITFPYDLLAGFPGWQTSFRLMHRQERSRAAYGRTFVKDLGDPLWTATFTTKSLTPNQLDAWRSKFEVLENGLNTFKGYVLSRCYPIAYPRGSWPTGASWDGSCTVAAIGSDGKSIMLNGLPDGFTFSTGDVVMIDQGQIYRVAVGGVVAAGLSPMLEVRPHIRSTTSVDDAATVKNPWCLMSVDPDSLDDTASIDGRGIITFSATEAV